MCLNRQNGVGPATDSLDHRAGAYYLPHSLLYNELCHAVGVLSLSVPPSTLLNILCTEVNQGPHHSEAKMDVLRLLINSCAGLKTQQLNIVCSSIKFPSKASIKEA